MLRCSRLAAKERKQVPAHEREAVALEIQELLDERGPDGRRVWSQARLGAALDGLSQETIRRAVHESGVTPAVRDGLLKLLRVDIDKLIQKHKGRTPKPPVAPGSEVDTLAMAREAAEQLAEAYGKSAEEVWPDFLHPFQKYKGEPWSVGGMVREVGKIMRQRLGIEPEDARAGADPILADEPGPPKKPRKK